MSITLNKEQFDALDEEAQKDFTLLQHGEEAVALPNAVLNTWGESNNAITGLRSALQKERENAEAARKEKHDLKTTLQGASSEQLAAAEAKAAEIESSANEQLAQLKTQLREARTERTVAEAVLTHRGTEPLRAVLHEAIKVNPETGEAYVQQGEERLTVDAYTAQLKENPQYAGCFSGSGHSGGGTPPGSAGSTPQSFGTTPESRGAMDASAKAAYISQHGINAFMEIPA